MDGQVYIYLDRYQMGRWVGRQIDRREMDRLLVANKQIEWW